MTDIVERLRDHADRLLLGGRNADTRILLEEAAQMIGTLRARLALWDAVADEANKARNNIPPD